MRRVLLVLTALVVAAVLSGCGHKAPAPVDVRPVQTVVVGKSASTLAAVYSGVISARNQSNQGFRVAGTVVKRLVQVGDHVNANQPLLQLDPANLELNQQAAKAQLDAARSKAAQAKVNLDRDATLLQQDFISQAQYDRDQVDLQSARSQVEMARAQYQGARNQADYGTLRAAVTGVVTDINVDVGQVVNAGTTAITIARHGDREVVISVPESRIDQLRHAQHLDVTLWADPKKQYPARLRLIDPQADPTTRTYAAHVTVLAPDAAVRLGMTAYVHLPRVKAGSGTNFTLPVTAIVEKPDGPHVWLVDGDTSAVTLHPVKLVTISGSVALIGGGLKKGDVVVTAGVNFLHSRQKVRVAGTYGPQGS